MYVSSEIAFRGNVPEVRDIMNYRQTPILPLPGWNSLANHIQFVIPTSEHEWLSSQFVLDYDFSIQLADDSDIPPNALVAFTDLPIASHWQSVKLQINGTIIEGLNSDWPIRSWISSILSMNRTAKDFYGKDLFKAYSDDPFKAQSKLDNENSAVFEVPELMLFSLLKTTLTENDYHRLQKNWQDLNCEPLEYLQCFCDGVSYPPDGYSMDFNDLTNTSGLYEAFIEICRLMSGDGSFTFSQWQGGKNLIPVQLANHYPSTKYSSPKKRGEVTVKIRFRAQLTEAYNLYSFSIASSQLSISRDRSIHFE